MIKVVYGNKGIGKTKYLIAGANALLENCTETLFLLIAVFLILLTLNIQSDM